jgi:hypothetical protein
MHWTRLWAPPPASLTPPLHRRSGQRRRGRTSAGNRSRGRSRRRTGGRELRPHRTRDGPQRECRSRQHRAPRLRAGRSADTRLATAARRDQHEAPKRRKTHHAPYLSTPHAGSPYGDAQRIRHPQRATQCQGVILVWGQRPGARLNGCPLQHTPTPMVPWYNVIWASDRTSRSSVRAQPRLRPKLRSGRLRTRNAARVTFKILSGRATRAAPHANAMTGRDDPA